MHACVADGVITCYWFPVGMDEGAMAAVGLGRLKVDPTLVDGQSIAM